MKVTKYTYWEEKYYAEGYGDEEVYNFSNLKEAQKKFKELRKEVRKMVKGFVSDEEVVKLDLHISKSKVKVDWETKKKRYCYIIRINN